MGDQHLPTINGPPHRRSRPIRSRLPSRPPPVAPAPTGTRVPVKLHATRPSHAVKQYMVIASLCPRSFPSIYVRQATPPSTPLPARPVRLTRHRIAVPRATRACADNTSPHRRAARCPQSGSKPLRTTPPLTQRPRTAKHLHGRQFSSPPQAERLCVPLTRHRLTTI